jgi:hypothetical protein
MNRFDELELSVETLRELSDDQLGQVAGGAAVSGLACLHTQTPVCPSGATWFTDCGSDS